jgi:hypothetical protein
MEGFDVDCMSQWVGESVDWRINNLKVHLKVELCNRCCAAATLQPQLCRTFFGGS